MTTLVQLTDMVTDDLEANVALAPHRTKRYVEPAMISSENTPMLTVYPATIRPPVTVTTDVVEETVTLVVQWSIPADDVAESGGAHEQARARQALETSDAILTKLYDYADGVAGNVSIIADVDRVEIGPTSGNIWRLRATLVVRELV